jgi:LDH2 family malate/lactate/ureidoglycolate dehydrogenase
MTQDTRYLAADLIAFAQALFRGVGMDQDKAAVVAELLVEADLFGHDTHGLQLAGPYLAELETGGMVGTGAPEVVSDSGTALTWDGRRLPGVWLTAQAVDLGVERATARGLAAVTIRRSHHIACLATFLERATDKDCVVVLASSDPNTASVAPFGGMVAVMTPNPIAAGIPTDGEPILIDISASITTNSMTHRLHKEGKRFPGSWLLDAQGRPSDDPAVAYSEPPGTILPLGGLDSGHKGYGLGLLIEALTQGLSGFGRAEPAEGWGASVFVLALDPAAFGGREAFARQTGWLAGACRDSPPVEGGPPVRLPGERALARKRAALRDGLDLRAGIMEALRPWAEKLGVPAPNAMPGD